MALLSPVARRLLFVLLSAASASQAEPILPLLRPTEAAGMRAQLQQRLPDTTRVKILLRLANDKLGRYEEYRNSYDNAAAYAQQAQALSARARFVPGQIGSLYVLGRLRNYSPTDTLGRALLRRGIALSRQRQLPQLQAYGLFYLSEAYPGTEQQRKRGLLSRSQALFRQAGAKLEEAYVLKTVADAHLRQGDTSLAIEELLQVLAIYRAAGHRKLHYTYDLLLVANEKAGNYKEALRYGFAMLESAQATRDTAAIGVFYVRMGTVYKELQQPQQAQTYYSKAVASFHSIDAKPHMMSAAGYVAQMLILQHKPQEALAFFTRTTQHVAPAEPGRHAYFMAICYVALKQYGLAEQYYLQSVKYFEKESDTFFPKTSTYEGIGKLYLLTKDYKKARWYLQLAMQRHQLSGYLFGVTNLHSLLFKVDSAQGRFVAAIAHYQRFKLLTDSAFNEAKNKQLAILQVQYDTRRKEQDIALLTKQTLVQQARIRQREWQRNALLLGAGGLALLLGLGYNRYRLKQRVNRLLHAQQREIRHKNESLEAVVRDKQQLLEEKEELLSEKSWMLKEIHHRVKNNLQVISSLLNTQVDFLRDPAALAALRESQNRVQAMALIHQKLYQSDNLALVDMQEYIADITAHLLESFDCLGTVHQQLHVAPLQLDVALATPLGLIINEAITNALKHAFPQGRRGTLTVALRPLDELRFELLITDDGVGLPPGLDLRRHESLGLTMLHGLSKQIGGALHIAEASGVQLTLQFTAVRNALRADAAPA